MSLGGSGVSIGGVKILGAKRYRSDGVSNLNMWELNLLHVESGVDMTPANTSQKKGIQTVAGRLVGIFKDIHLERTGLDAIPLTSWK